MGQLVELELKDIGLSHYGEGKKIPVQEFECIVQTLQTFGQTNALIVDQDDKLVAGYKIYKGLKYIEEEYVFCIQMQLTDPDRELLSVLLNYQDKGYDYVEMSKKLKVIMEKYSVAQLHRFLMMPSHDIQDIAKLLDWSMENYKPKETMQIGLDL